MSKSSYGSNVDHTAGETQASEITPSALIRRFENVGVNLSGRYSRLSITIPNVRSARLSNE